MPRKAALDVSELEGAGVGAVASGGGSAVGAGADLAHVNPLTGQAFSQRYYKIKEKREALPVWKYLEEIGSQLEKSQVIIIEGETGSGKTTQVRAEIGHLFRHSMCHPCLVVCDTDPSVPCACWLWSQDRGPHGRLYAASSSCCNEHCSACSRRDGCEAWGAGGVHHSLRGCDV